jgi:REP element-mobilizing transposase RayT
MVTGTIRHWLSMASRAAREFNMPVIWQRNFYEHIIRNETAYQNIWNYIQHNPTKWEEDQLRPGAPPNQFNLE